MTSLRTPERSTRRTTFKLGDVLESCLRKSEFIFSCKYMFKFDKKGTGETCCTNMSIFLTLTYPFGLNPTTMNHSIHSVPCPHKVFLLETGNKIFSHDFPKSQKMLITIFYCHVVTEGNSYPCNLIAPLIKLK